jgi:hypothetical protein
MKLTPLPLTVLAMITVGLPAPAFAFAFSSASTTCFMSWPSMVDHVPSEAAIFFFQRLDVHHVFHPAVDLEAVAVDDADQVVELEVARFHRGFPDLAFLLLAVSHDAEDVVIFLVQLGGQRHADSNAQALAERSGRDFYAGQFEPVRMPLIRRIEFAQQRDVFLRAEAGEGKAQIKAGRFVARRPDDAIAIPASWDSWDRGRRREGRARR